MVKAIETGLLLLFAFAPLVCFTLAIVFGWRARHFVPPADAQRELQRQQEAWFKQKLDLEAQQAAMEQAGRGAFNPEGPARFFPADLNRRA